MGKLKARDRQILFWLAVLSPAFSALAKVLMHSIVWNEALAYLIVELPISFMAAKMRPPGTIEAPPPTP